MARNLFNRLRPNISSTPVDDDFLTRKDDKDNGKVPASIQLSRSEDESSNKSNSDEDKPPSPLKNLGLMDRATRELRKGMKEAGDKGGKNIKVGMKVAGEKVKEGMKEAGEKTGEKVKEGMKEAGEKVKEGMKEAGEKVKEGMKEAAENTGEKVKEGMKEAGEKTGEKVKEGMKEAGEKVKEGMKEAAEKAGDKVKEGLKDISVDHKISADLKIITTSNRFIAVIELIAGLSFLSNIKYDIDDIRFFITSCLGAFLFWFCLYKNRV